MKFTLKSARKFDRNGRKGFIYNSNEDFEGANVVYMEMKGRHGKVKNTKSDRIYYILEGKGKFVTGDKVQKVEKTDVVIVPKNTPYDFEAIEETTLKLILVSCPAFDREAEVKLE